MDFRRLESLTDEELADALRKIPGNKNLPRRPLPEMPSSHNRRDVTTRLKEIQSFLSSFEYNHTGVSFVRKRRDRGASHVLTTAKELIRESLPIQCVEAVFIALLMTNDMDDITAYPLSFKSSVGSSKQVYRHIVLAVTANGKWGALGISRCRQLMGKDLRFSSLADLINDFQSSYTSVCHNLLKVYVALPFSRETNGPIRWRALNLDMSRPWEDIVEMTRAFTQRGRGLLDLFDRTGRLPPECIVANSKKKVVEDDSDGSDGDGEDGAVESEKKECMTSPANSKSIEMSTRTSKQNTSLAKGRPFGI